MLRQEIDVVAKAIRNSNCSLADKKDIVDFICYEMIKYDPLFNAKRIRDLAIHTLKEE